MRYDPTVPTGNSGDVQPGTYEFKVADAVETVSANGNPQIKVTLIVYTPQRELNIFDYLVSTPGGLWKVKMFCAETGLDFDAGEIDAAQCVGLGGKAVLDFDKRDIQDVKDGTRQRAYLKVRRYGLHEDKPQTRNGVPQARVAAPVRSDGPPPPTDADVPAEPTEDTIPF